ncbi:CLAVATA3/ESR (CLE)-related protein 45 [Ziziphus jujuba]|uniref:CLAVATA3/ESR (CLE)-related protein 45 n=1 Tax=Ziziphus jujuba TaxID=326968 RepID=A0A6P6GIS1_ZIZJJ|nr:CLAVATA3/ESR (CLE)-related protein 45 [Ziziphus jujuba]
MVLTSHRVLILLICIGFLVVQPDKVSGLRSIGIAIRETKKDHDLLLSKNQRILKAVNMEEINTTKNSKTSDEKFDPNQSSKRKVRRGADPIHNRS